MGTRPSPPAAPGAHRPIPSFVHQRNRLTGGQQHAWERLWPAHGRDVADVVAGSPPFDPPSWFGRTAPVVLEIGPGMGESTAELAAAAPDVDHLAVEVFEPGLASLLMRIDRAGLTNVAVLRGDAVDLLEGAVPPDSLAGIRIFFPDPWPKRRHHKRRLVQPPFVTLAASRLRPGGTLHLATDWADYADQMHAVCTAEPLVENTAEDGGASPRPAWRPVTKFEERARAEGRAVHDLIFRRVTASHPELITGSDRVQRCRARTGASRSRESEASRDRSGRSGGPRSGSPRVHRTVRSAAPPPTWLPSTPTRHASSSASSTPRPARRPRSPRRMVQIHREIDATGSYTHTLDELTFGARIAWRGSARCIGRLYWNSLKVRDMRHAHTPSEVAAGCVSHLREATRGGRIRSTITVFAPRRPGWPGPRIHNEQLVRYAGHRTATGGVRGDGRYVGFTDEVTALGWRPPDVPGRFDVLPLLISDGSGEHAPQLFDLPADAVLEVPLSHPDLPWFADLRLRWHAVPAISNMPLEIGGVHYPAAPFNGWYLGTEIGARNLADADRYDLLPVIAARMGLDTSSPRTLWRDRAVVELVRAVQHSFDAAGVTMADHHSESERFLTHVGREADAGRRCPADWSWIVPPVSGGLTPVYHRYYDEPDPEARPAFLPAEGPQLGGGASPGTVRVRPRNSATAESPVRTVTS